MSVFVIFSMVELSWIVSSGYAYRANAFHRFAAWFGISSSMVVISTFMVALWFVSRQRPDWSLWWLVALAVINLPLALIWRRRMEQLRPVETA